MEINEEILQKIDVDSEQFSDDELDMIVNNPSEFKQAFKKKIADTLDKTKKIKDNENENNNNEDGNKNEEGKKEENAEKQKEKPAETNEQEKQSSLEDEKKSIEDFLKGKDDLGLSVDEVLEMRKNLTPEDFAYLKNKSKKPEDNKTVPPDLGGKGTPSLQGEDKDAMKNVKSLNSKYLKNRIMAKFNAKVGG